MIIQCATGVHDTPVWHCIVHDAYLIMFASQDTPSTKDPAVDQVWLFPFVYPLKLFKMRSHRPTFGLRIIPPPPTDLHVSLMVLDFSARYSDLDMIWLCIAIIFEREIPPESINCPSLIVLGFSVQDMILTRFEYKFHSIKLIDGQANTLIWPTAQFIIKLTRVYSPW